ncbi:DUF4097 family beta strand repeat-containing protein [Lactobacillus sp. B4007]|uniref:DUF4097 family beta strand repeat-containing protein n=1 Tax=Lactobacillus sp. B4007 TaxID=2818032 RepID=UPI002269BE67|nr:DUF4097 family beta strand repeat-containing protein [Lactobacillus sp. B4007]MCX8724823.1 DUF4097 family beta strand repeat protein [Lactobacillus sp. B4007]
MNKRHKLYIVSAVIVVLLIAIGWWQYNSHNYTTGNQTSIQKTTRSSKHGKDNDKDEQTKTSNVKEFNEVDFHTSEPEIQISQGKKYQVTIVGTEPQKIKANVKNGKLTVSDNGERTYKHDDGMYQVIILVPNTSNIKKVTGFSYMGSVKLDGLNIDNIKMKSAYGDINLNNIKTENAVLRLKEGDLNLSKSILKNGSLTSTDSDINITNSQFKANGKTETGNFKIKKSKILGNSKLVSTYGNFKVNNLSKISYDLKTGPTADISFFGDHKLSLFYHVETGAPTLKIRSKYGDIKIF